MIYDITQELFTSVVFPGDPAPKASELPVAPGGAAHVSFLEMCAHNGTHMDAPRHFLPDGYGIDAIPLEKCVGEALVVDAAGRFTASDAARLPADCRRLLLRGGAIPDAGGAAALAARGVDLIGVEPQSVGAGSETTLVHKTLLAAGIAVLEGIRLSSVTAGKYFLFAAPMKLGGLDGAPVRAVLLDL